jgi:hypothetical protein
MSIEALACSPRGASISKGESRGPHFTVTVTHPRCFGMHFGVLGCSTVLHQVPLTVFLLLLPFPCCKYW